MKKLFVLILCFAFALSYSSFANATELTIGEGANALEEHAQFPFKAETDELAVNLRAEEDSKAAKVGRLERGTKLTVIGETINDVGELWYAVELEDGTQGFIRSDLLVESEIMAAERAANPLPETTSASQVIGNRNSKKYHETWCHTLPKESNRVYFDFAEEAENEGYVHCKNCD